MRLAAAAALAYMAMAAAAFAQQGFRCREGSLPPRYAPAQMPDGFFTICRLQDRSVRSGPMPRVADRLSLRRSPPDETCVGADQDARHQQYQGAPHHWVVRLTDDALFNCPIILASDVGTIGFQQESSRDCSPTFSRAASPGPTTPGEHRRGGNGPARSRASCRRTLFHVVRRDLRRQSVVQRRKTVAIAGAVRPGPSWRIHSAGDEGVNTSLISVRHGSTIT
jgi:hypothetical protein